MSEKRLVKVENILQNQIPSFLSGDSPLFQEFLNQYYISQSHPTGLLDIVSNLNSFKHIDSYTKDVFYTHNTDNACYLTEKLYTFSDVIFVNSTFGFPEKYGLIQIDDEIITYTGKTEDSFTGCARGFSGITDINDTPNTSSLVFTSSSADEHSTKSTVKNLNLIFYSKLFEKFKAHYLPDFEKREFNSNISLELILSRARDFYLSKGSDISYKILFELLYNDNISVFKPKEYIIKPSLNNTLTTKNILVELISGTINTESLTELIGLTIFQDISDSVTASASIYNVEYRPTDDLDLFEISLDSESFIYDFVSTKKTSIIERITDGFFVDSTVGFPSSGTVYVKIKSNESNRYETFTYESKSINKFSNISNIGTNALNSIKSNDEIIENKLAQIILDDGSTLKFRLLNVIQSFDYSGTNTAKINDIINVSSFGRNFSESIEYNSWIYNYPTYHNIKEYDSFGFITLHTPINFKINESIDLISSSGVSTSSRVINIIASDRIQVTTNNFTSIDNIKTIRKNIIKSNLNNLEPAYIQNVYYNQENESVVVATSGLPFYYDISSLNSFEFRLVGIGNVFSTNDLNTNTPIKHKLLSGTRIYFNSEYSGITTGYYFIKAVTDTAISLYKSAEKLCLSFSDPTILPEVNLNDVMVPSYIGTATIVNYENVTKGFSNQLLLKEFPVKTTLNNNKVSSSNQINNVEDAYLAFKS